MRQCPDRTPPLPRREVTNLNLLEQTVVELVDVRRARDVDRNDLRAPASVRLTLRHGVEHIVRGAVGLSFRRCVTKNL